MQAAVVRSFHTPPAYEEFPAPAPTGPHETLVNVLAAGLHPRVRSAADGSHYTSDGTLPMIPGIDAVGRTADGELLYFVAPDTALGTMADQAVVDRRRAVPLPAGADPVVIAAAMNPAMSAWIALRRRATLHPGGTVLILGATGNAGQLAVQIARHLGAGHVIAAGRDPHRRDLLKHLGADEVTALTPDDLTRTAAPDADIVLDYLWGAPTHTAMPALLTARTDRAKPLTWIQIGSVAGPELTLPSAWLRAANLSVLGSGQGSISTAGIVAELPALAAALTTGAFTVNPQPHPLSDVTATWQTRPTAGTRVVLIP